MKHLIKFNESKPRRIKDRTIHLEPGIENIEKIRDVYDELKYIIEDEGYDISFNDWKESINIIIDSEFCKNGKWDIQEEYEEFLDRIKEALPEFKIDSHDIGEDDITTKIIVIKNRKNSFPLIGSEEIISLFESKSERRNVVRQVVKDIIEIFKKEGEGDYILPEEISGEQEYEFDNLNTSFTLELEIIKDSGVKAFELEGGYFVEDEIMEICIIYNPSKFPNELYNLSSELNELIRHELQHLIQYERGDDQTEDNSSRENYYSTPHEIDAQVKGFKRIAKLKGVPFDQVVREWFEKNKKTHKLKNDASERVIKKILSYDSNKLNESFSFYDKKWENELPEMMSVIKDGKKYQFKRGNVMLNADMIQILYNNDVYGSPNTLEFDIYFSFNNNDNSIKLDIDITYGDLMVSEFSIEPPNKVSVIEYTSYHSKFNPGGVFALDNSSLNGLIRYLNKFGRGINLNLSDLKFLDKFDNYDPNQSKVLENFNKSEFTFAEILQDLRDDYDIRFTSNSTKQRDWNNVDLCIRETDATHDMFLDIIGDNIKSSPLEYDLKIINNTNRKSYEEMYDQIEELVDRFEEKNMYVYSVYFGMVIGDDRKYVALPPPEEIYNLPPRCVRGSLKYSIGEIYPSYITIEFRSNKRNLEPTTKFGKFINKFRDNTKTKYSEYTDDTGPR